MPCLMFKTNKILESVVHIGTIRAINLSLASFSRARELYIAPRKIPKITEIKPIKTWSSKAFIDKPKIEKAS